MKAIVYHSYGSPAVLKLAEIEKPCPKDTEVLIKIHAASINSWDWDLLRGRPFIVRIGGLRKPRFKILGADIAGTVETVGKNVKHLKPGDEVFGDISGGNWGGFAEYVCADENALARKSSRMTFDEAAAIPQAGVLALQGLRDNGKIRKGQKVLINGGGGGVGTFAIQIAKSMGTEVTAVDSTGKLDFMRSVGADHVIDYTREDYTKNGECYDLVLDVMAHQSIFDLKRALTATGIYVMIGGSMARIFQLMILGPWISMFSRKKMGLLMHKPSKKDLDVLTTLFESGLVVPVIDKCYSLCELPVAIQSLGDGRTHGKVIITM